MPTIGFPDVKNRSECFVYNDIDTNAMLTMQMLARTSRAESFMSSFLFMWF